MIENPENKSCVLIRKRLRQQGEQMSKQQEDGTAHEWDQVKRQSRRYLIVPDGTLGPLRAVPLASAAMARHRASESVTGRAANPTGALRSTPTYRVTSIRRANFPCPEWTYSNKRVR